MKVDATKNGITMFKDCLNALQAQPEDIKLQFITNCMTYERESLQNNYSQSKEKSTTSDTALRLLCQSLLTSLTRYENDKNLSALHGAWKEAIKDAKPVLSNHIDYKNSFINIAFIVLSLGIFLIGLGIRACVTKNEHSFFYPIAKTEPMKILEKLETLADELPIKDVKSISAT